MNPNTINFPITGLTHISFINIRKTKSHASFCNPTSVCLYQISRFKLLDHFDVHFVKKVTSDLCMTHNTLNQKVREDIQVFPQCISSVLFFGFLRLSSDTWGISEKQYLSGISITLSSKSCLNLDWWCMFGQYFALFFAWKCWISGQRNRNIIWPCEVL